MAFIGAATVPAPSRSVSPPGKWRDSTAIAGHGCKGYGNMSVPVVSVFPECFLSMRSQNATEICAEDQRRIIHPDSEIEEQICLRLKQGSSPTSGEIRRIGSE